MIESEKERLLREMQDSPLARMAREMQDSPLARMAREMQDSPLARMAREMQDEYRLSVQYYGQADVRALASLDMAAANLDRSNQWVHSASESTALLASQLPANSPIFADLERMRSAANYLVDASDQADLLRMNEQLSLEGRYGTNVETARLKLSALAGFSDIESFATLEASAAYQQLFGDWHTTPNLPSSFWRDPAERHREYEKAEVDPGLIESSPTTAIEIVVGSGFAPGLADGSTSIALFDVAGMTMQIRSSDPCGDAFRVIGVFERSLRLLIAAKLQKIAGPKWFKQRIDGILVSKARENRETALRNGEQERDLLSYLDLGDLVRIVLRKENWNEIFGYIFPNQNRFEFDLQALVAYRRPVMHARNVDAVLLVELMCIIRRINQFIESDGEWRRISDSED